VDSPAAVGARLKEARERAGLSQRQLSFLGCSPAYISRIESGDRIPSLQLLRELGRRLGVSEDYLATGAADRGGRGAELAQAEVALRLDELDASEGLFEQILGSAVTDAEKAEAHAGLGQLASRRGYPREAIKFLEQARGMTDRMKRAAVAEALGRAYFQAALDEADARQDDIETMRFAVLLASALIDTGNLGRAEELLGRALALGDKSQDPLVRARLYWSQSRLHAERNDQDTAADYARRALEILLLTEDTYRTARGHQLLAHIELDRGNADEALILLERGWPLLERSGNKLERAQYRLEEARALAMLERSEEAAALAMQVSGLISDAAPEDAARSYTVLGSVYEELGENSRAREVYELAAELLEPRNPNRFLIEVYSKLADLAEAEGRKEEAYDYMKKAVRQQRAVSDSLVH
jgi:transcriptional regulator with XRE-family HTH domain